MSCVRASSQSINSDLVPPSVYAFHNHLLILVIYNFGTFVVTAPSVDFGFFLEVPCILENVPS